MMLIVFKLEEVSSRPPLPKAAPKDNSTHWIVVEASRSSGAVARAQTIGVNSCALTFRTRVYFWMRRWLEEVEGGLALGAGEVGDKAGERKAANALGAVGLDLFRAGERNAETLDKPFHRVALKNIVGPNPRGGKRAEKR